MRELFLYSKESCSLCDEMLLQVQTLLHGSVGICHVIKVTGDPELEQRYGARVPVLVGGNEVLCQAYLEEAAVKTYLNLSD